jgi:hypothetical protein
VALPVVPGVPEELEPALHRLLEFFGLGHLFAEPDAEEGEPPAAATEPEPEPDGDEAAPETGPSAEKVLVVAEGESVDLPPKSIDELIEAKYGQVEPGGKSIDVTELVLDEIDDDGALREGVLSS